MPARLGCERSGDLYLNEIGSARGSPERGRQVQNVSEPLGGHAIGFGQLAKIRWRGRYADRLDADIAHRSFDLAIASIVPDHENDRRSGVKRRADFRQRELETAIAGQADDRRSRIGKRRSDCRRRPVAQRAEAGGGVEPAPGRSWS